MARKPTVCAGFPRRGGCPNPPGTPWTDYWCSSCDERRRASLSAQFDAIATMMGRGPADAPGASSYGSTQALRAQEEA